MSASDHRLLALDLSISSLCKENFIQTAVLTLMSTKLDSYFTVSRINVLLDEVSAHLKQSYHEQRQRLLSKLLLENQLPPNNAQSVSLCGELRGAEFGSACMIRLARVVWSARLESDRRCLEHGMSQRDAALMVQTVTLKAVEQEVYALDVLKQSPLTTALYLNGEVEHIGFGRYTNRS
jgi:hypothetical protein